MSRECCNCGMQIEPATVLTIRYYTNDFREMCTACGEKSVNAQFDKK